MVANPWRFVRDIERDRNAGVLEAWAAEGGLEGIFALVAEADQSKIHLLQDACRTFDIPLLGAVVPELIADSAFEKHGMLLSGMSQMPHYELADLEDSEKDGAALAERLAERLHESVETTLFLLFDNLVGSVGTVLEQLYLRLADRVHYAGVNVGSETFKPMPCVFDNEQIKDQAVLAMLLNQTRGALLAHGYRIPDDMISATSSEGNCIRTIDWRPAFEVYQEMVKKHYNAEVTRENFYEYGTHFPFGIVRASNEVLVRLPTALTDDGALFCAGEVPENSVLTLLEGPPDELRRAVEWLGDRVGERSEGAGMVFVCAGRCLHLGPANAMTEMSALREKIGDFVGATSLGEIGSSEAGGHPQFHNTSIVYCPWGIHAR